MIFFNRNVCVWFHTSIQTSIEISIGMAIGTSIATRWCSITVICESVGYNPVGGTNSGFQVFSVERHDKEDADEERQASHEVDNGVAGQVFFLCKTKYDEM